MPTDNSTWDDSQPSSGELENQGESGEGTSEPAPSDRSAQSRIQELIGKNKELNERLESLENQVRTNPVPMPPTSLETNPAAQKIAGQIKDLGFVDESKFNEKFEELQARVQLDSLHGSLETKFDGSNGLPKYDRGEVEKFMRERGISNPEWAYEKLYPTEFLDWQIKNANKPKGPQTELPSAPKRNDDREITREKIREWMQTPEGREKYEANRDKILTLMSQGQL